MVIEILSGILYGVVGGVVYGLAGYVKAKQVDGTPFEIDGFASTVIFSGIAGGVVSFTGQPLDLFVTGSEGAFLSIIVKKVYGAIKDWFTKKL
jgi:hypothetical protein